MNFGKNIKILVSKKDKSPQESHPPRKQNPCKLRNVSIFSSSDEEDSPSDYKCQLCSVYFSNREQFQMHVASKKHSKMETKAKAKTTALINHQLRANAATASDEEDRNDEGYYCEVCEKTMEWASYEAHIQGSRHTKKLKERHLREKLKDQPGVYGDDNPRNSDEEDSLPTPIAECKLCGKKFHDSRSFRKHMMSEAHKKKAGNQKVEEKLKRDQSGGAENGGDGEGDPQFQKCSLCNMIFSGAKPFKQHIMGRVHDKAVKRAEAEKELKSFFEKDVETGNLTCKDCKRVYPDPHAFKLHLENNSHEKQKGKDAVLQFVKDHPEIAVSKPLQSINTNDTDESEENDSYQKGSFFLTCKVCHFCFTSVGNAGAHIASNNHIKAMAEKARKKQLKKTMEQKEQSQEQTASSSKLDSNTASNLIASETELQDDFEVI